MSATFRGSIYIKTYEDKLFNNLANVSIANAFRNIGKHFEGVAIGAISDAIEVNAGPAYGTGTISIATGNMANNDTITINSVVLTAKTSPSGTAQFGVGSSALLTAINLTACINANPTLLKIVRASYAKGTVTTTGVVTVTALNAGTGGNYTWSQSGSNVTLAGASAMTGGTNGPVQATATITSTGSATNNETMLLCNQTLTAKTSGAVPANGEFNISGTVAVQATSIALAINSLPALTHVVTATSALGVVTVTAVPPGTIGNGFQISESLTNVTAAAFAGGVNGPVLILHKGL